MKKTLLTLVCAVIASLYATSSFAAVGDVFTATVGGIDMTFKVIADDEVQVYTPTKKISAIDRATAGAITIPSTVSDGVSTYYVTEIADYAFYICESITSVNIEASIKTIGELAFKNCSALERINIPASVTTIGVSAFENDRVLERVDITDPSRWCEIDFGNKFANPTNYNYGLYVNGTQITTSITLTDATCINAYAFIGLSGVTQITIPATVSAIKNNAFYLCPNITTVYVDDLGSWCQIDFESTAANPASSKTLLLTGGDTPTTIPSGTTAIKDYAFYSIGNITSMTIPATVETIGTQAFFSCKGLISVTIDGSGLTSIGEQAFKSCSALERINIPASVTTIGVSAFENAKVLERVDITDLGKWCEIDFGNRFANPTNYKHKLFLGGAEVEGDLVIPEGTTKVGSYAFYNYGSLTSLTIPASVITIGASAFATNYSITDVYCGGAPAEAGTSPFGTNDADVIRSAIFHVPFDHLASYNVVEEWNRVRSYIAALDETSLTSEYVYSNMNSFTRLNQNIKVEYTREFKNNKWQALFLPFNMSYSDFSELFNVAAILDNQTAGEPINVAHITSGTLIAGKPYLIKAKSAGTKTLTATVSSMTASNDDNNPWTFGDCTYTGVYTTINGLKTLGAWAMSGGLLARPSSDEVTLKPFRWYMTEASGTDVKEANLSFVLFEGGYEDAPNVFDEETAIEQISSTTAVANDIWYTLSGQRITQPTKRGIYIKNGKKVMF